MSDDIQKQHRVPHIPRLRVDPDIADVRFPEACSMTKCSGVCCRKGVWMDPLDQARILQHVDAIQRVMDANQEKRPELWFYGEKPSDPDFPSGRAVGTAATKDGCVFLNSEKRCVLQLASTGATGNLKPFFCVAFPITIDSGTLCVDEGRDPACCVEDSDGPKNVLDLCSFELNYVLGPEGFAEFSKRFR
jgi:hypothetical protein